MTRRRFEPSVFAVGGRSEDIRRRYAERLLVSGFDIEAAAAMTGLPVADVREIAAKMDDDFLGGAPSS
jgi:hypothetical protein